VTGDFKATSYTTTAATVLVLTGDLDAATAPQALKVIHTLAVPSGQQLIVDLSGLVFCDSSGISALLAARNLAMAAGAGIALISPSSQLRRSFALMGLADFFPVYPTIDDAQNSQPCS
jgi:anti-sigma B factor antagonist